MRIMLCALLVSTAYAGDWPQILGPNRTGIAEGERIPASIPAGGLRVAWESPAGEGFAGAAVAKGRVFLFHRVGDEEVLDAFAVTSGDRLWRRAFPTDYRPGYTSDGGPRCVPVVHGDRVYVYGAQGGLRCLSADKGEVVWQIDTHTRYSAPEGFFGAGSTPLVEEDRLIVNVGGRNGAGVVAFDKRTGKELWQSVTDTASYSSPIAVTVGDSRQVIVISRMQTSGLDPKSGKILWSFPFGKRGPTVNGSSPVILENAVFVTSSYGIGSVLADLRANDAAVVWRDSRLLASQYATPVAIGSHLYAVDGRQDTGVPSLVCLSPREKKVLWKKDGIAYGTLIGAANRLLLLTHTGRLAAFEANSASYQELWQTQVLGNCDRGYRLPALSDGRLFVRDDAVLKCLVLSETGAAKPIGDPPGSP